MSDERTVPRVEALNYVASWKAELDLRQKELYSRLLSGAMGGVATIVLSSGLALDKLSQAGWLVRFTLGLALLLLLLGAGNIMNCFALAVNGQLLLLQKERQLVLSNLELISLADLSTLDQELTGAVAKVQRNYTYSYFCILLAVVSGAFTFLITLVRA
jgi:hypothetical protein